MEKRGSSLQQVTVHIILVALILALLVFAVLGRSNSGDVKRQVIEKQLALLIESGKPGTILEINKQNAHGLTLIEEIKIDENKIYVKIESSENKKGYPFFSKYRVEIKELESKFQVIIK
jgi:hypothetical protein